MLVIAAEAFVAEPAHEDGPGLVGRIALDADRHRPDGVNLARTGMGAIEADQAAHDPERARVSIGADDHAVGGAETVVDRLVEGVPPGRFEVIDGLV